MVMDKPFTTASPVLANYNYTDIATGTGLEKFYLSQTKTTTETTYDLIKESFYSSNINISSGNYSFDMSPITLPRTVVGTAYIILHYYTGSGASGGITASLYKVGIDDTETLIGTEEPHINTDSKKTGTAVAKIEVSENVISYGEKLRLKIESDARIYTNPLNESWGWSYGVDSGTYDYSDSNVIIPFKLDL